MVLPDNIGGFMSKKFNFTINTLTKLIPPETGRDEYRDTNVPELTLRVTSNGTKSFSVSKRIKDKYVRATLGRFPANTMVLSQTQIPPL
jgi:hypothetical protein